MSNHKPSDDDGNETSTTTETTDTSATASSATANHTAANSSKPGKPSSDAMADNDSSSSSRNNNDATSDRKTAAKKSYADWPLKDIKEPHENDVMYGRGGGTNHHPGNKRYRKLVEERKVDYVNSKRLDKPLVALEIIRQWRAQEPPGRFLKLDEKTGYWNDVGDKKAREKTSQALREKAPQIRKQQEEERMAKSGKPAATDNNDSNMGNGETDKSTRFAEGTKTEAQQQASQVNKPMLARDHSLGREFLTEGEKMSLDGFSWQDPFQSSRSISFSSMGSLPGIAAAVANANNNANEDNAGAPVHPGAPPPPPPPPPPPHAVYGPPAGRTSSHGSMGMHPPYHASVGGPPPHMHSHPPPPPDYYGRVTSAGGGDDRRRQFSSGRFESWGSIGSLGSLQPYPVTAGGSEAGGPPPPSYVGPPPPPGAFATHQRSGSWTHPPPPPPSRGPTHQRSGSWSHGREHSLMLNPLANATTSYPATPFGGHMGGGRNGSGYWEPGMAVAPYTGSPSRSMPGPGSPTVTRHSAPPAHRPMGPYRESSNAMSPYGGRSPANSQGSSPKTGPSGRSNGGSTTPKPNYNFDMNIAKTWSAGGAEVRKAWSEDGAIGGGRSSSTSWGKDQYERPLNDVGTDSRPSTSPMRAHLPKPSMVKRDTSHQNENCETKPSIKRAALNRDQSATSNRLKQQYLPEYYDGRKDNDTVVVHNNGGRFDQDMRMLSDNLEETNLNKDGSIKEEARVKPKPLGTTDRLSTIDHIAMNLMSKPAPLLADNRTSTIDALDLNLEDEVNPIIDSASPDPLPAFPDNMNNNDSNGDTNGGMLARPRAMKEENRLSTMDFLEMVKEPLKEEEEPLSGDDHKSLSLTDEPVTKEWLAKV